MRRFIMIASAVCALAACDNYTPTDQAADRQAQATRSAMNAADREVGMPRIINFAQKKLLKNAYEDMDQTTLTYVYSQALDGKFVCLGQAIGYGVSLGTQFTASQYPQLVNIHGANSKDNASGYGYVEMLDQPEPNGLYQPNSGAATIVDLIDPATGQAHTALVEPNVVTVPFKLPASTVNGVCPAEVAADKVKDVKETSVTNQH
jgi:hypothetical protein